MKPAIRVIALLLFCHLLSGQSVNISNLPSPVKDEFDLLYPDAESVSWKVQHTKYLATFRNNKMETMALIREDGKLLQTETQIKIIALPPSAAAYLQEESKSKKIESAAILESESGVITFKAMVDKEEFWFDADGHVCVYGAVSIGSGGTQ
ncbi:MAG TPA: hypothetical protein VJ508_14595 [Saprospiraceae bacterium]|nr:hypothetical protein [Saprospiraceae bacterium]